MPTNAKERISNKLQKMYGISYSRSWKDIKELRMV